MLTVDEIKKSILRNEIEVYSPAANTRNKYNSPADPATTTHIGGQRASEIHDIEARNIDQYDDK